MTDTDLREGLAAVGALLMPLTPDQWDQCGAATRDMLVGMGLDPSDPTVLRSGLAASWTQLSHLLVLGCTFVEPLTLQWAQTEVFRRWVDGELPIPTADVMPGLE